MSIHKNTSVNDAKQLKITPRLQAVVPLLLPTRASSGGFPSTAHPNCGSGGFPSTAHPSCGLGGFPSTTHPNCGLGGFPSPQCRVVADIGCDHGKLAVYLLRNQYCERVIATDVSAPSLEKAAKAAREYCLQEQMELRLGNGLEPLAKGETDCAVIAGMGGELISEILKNSVETASAMQALLLQPMQNAPELRAYLRTNGWVIIDEAVCMEGHRIYEWIKIKRGSWDRDDSTILSQQWIDFLGPVLWQRREPLLKERLQVLRSQLMQNIDRTKQSESTKSLAAMQTMQERLIECEHILRLLEQEKKSNAGTLENAQLHTEVQPWHI